LGAGEKTVTIWRSDGKVMYRDFVSGEGLSSNQSHIQIFGLEDVSATEITVQYINGEKETRTGNFVNTLVQFSSKTKVEETDEQQPLK
jgi:enediyne biosynthesis protein E4